MQVLKSTELYTEFSKISMVISSVQVVDSSKCDVIHVYFSSLSNQKGEKHNHNSLALVYVLFVYSLCKCRCHSHILYEKYLCSAHIFL